jgi:ABC-type glycerol-3-phosphate transport system permease component
MTVIIPFEAIALPLYLVVRQLGWLDSYQALIVPTLANAFNIFLLRQFFMGIPRELEEAAIIDGASRLRIFFQIVVPLSWPALISTALISFQGSWDAFIWPLIVTNSPEVRVLQIGISNLSGQDAIFWDDLFAAVALAAIVPIILFIIFQRYYAQGISTTGLKG